MPGVTLDDPLKWSKSAWEASRENLDLFFVALKSPRHVLERWERNSTNSVRKAFEFSLVPVAISLLIELPYLAFFLPDLFTLHGIGGELTLFYVQTIIWSLALFAVGWLFRGKATLEDCITTSLVFMANIWPFNTILQYGMIANPVLVCARVTGTPVSPSWGHVDHALVNYYFWLSAPLVVYLCVVLVPAVRYVQRTGWVREMVIFMLYEVAGSTTSDWLLKPIWAKIYHACS